MSIALLSGDAEGPVRAAAKTLGIAEYSADLLPEGRLAALEAIITEEWARDPAPAWFKSEPAAKRFHRGVPDAMFPTSEKSFRLIG